MCKYGKRHVSIHRIELMILLWTFFYGVVLAYHASKGEFFCTVGCSMLWNFT